MNGKGLSGWLVCAMFCGHLTVHGQAWAYEPKDGATKPWPRLLNPAPLAPDAPVPESPLVERLRLQQDVKEIDGKLLDLSQRGGPGAALGGFGLGSLVMGAVVAVIAWLSYGVAEAYRLSLFQWVAPEPAPKPPNMTGVNVLLVGGLCLALLGPIVGLSVRDHREHDREELEGRRERDQRRLQELRCQKLPGNPWCAP